MRALPGRASIRPTTPRARSGGCPGERIHVRLDASSLRLFQNRADFDEIAHDTLLVDTCYRLMTTARPLCRPEGLESTHLVPCRLRLNEISKHQPSGLAQGHPTFLTLARPGTILTLYCDQEEWISRRRLRDALACMARQERWFRPRVRCDTWIEVAISHHDYTRFGACAVSY